MRVFIVAYNDGEYSGVASLTEVLKPEELTLQEKVFTSFEKASAYADEWASRRPSYDGGRARRIGDGGITIFQAEMDL